MEKNHSKLEVLGIKEAEAQAKTILLIELAAFFKEFDARRLTGSIMLYILTHHYADRYRSNLNKSINKQKWTNPYKTIKVKSYGKKGRT